MKYFIHLAYKGTHYHGWQRQAAHTSVQQVLEDAVRKMTGLPINCIGCGRTDTGVHASQYYCHIKLEEAFDYDPVFRLNNMLPDDIAVLEVFPVPWEAHAQNDATARTYRYHVHTQKDAFLGELSAYYPYWPTNMEKMKEAALLLPGEQDFRAFCRQPDTYKHTMCKVSEAFLHEGPDSGQFYFQITADRFLRGMVRNIMGALLRIGSGKMSFDDFALRLQAGTPPPTLHPAHPKGLFLAGVRYPYVQ